MTLLVISIHGMHELRLPALRHVLCYAFIHRMLTIGITLCSTICKAYQMGYLFTTTLNGFDTSKRLPLAL